MKISLFQGILVGVFVVGAGLGLFVFATYKGGSGAEGGVGTVIIWGTLPKEGIDTALTEIALADDSLKSTSYVQKSPVTLVTDLASAIATGDSPDLVLASQEELRSLVKYITPIPSESLPASTFTSAFVEEANLFTAPAGTGYYGLPFLIDPLILFWNENMLSSNGIARPPSTWEGLIGLVPNVAQLTPNRQITRGLIDLGTYDNVHNARGILSALFLQANVPLSVYSPDTGILSANLGESVPSSGGTPPGPSVLGFYTQFADPTKVSYTWNDSLKDSQAAFQTGELAMYLGYASESRFFKVANPNLNFRVAPLPQSGTAQSKTTYGLVYAFMIPRGAKNASGGFAAAAFLSNPTQQSIMAKTTGLVPVTRSVLASPPSTDAVASVAYSSALYAKGWLSPAPTAVDTIFSGMIKSVVSGRSAADSALGTAVGSLSLLLQK